MTQQPLGFSQLDALRNAVKAACNDVGRKQIVTALGISAGLLSDALGDKNDRNIRLSWLPEILRLGGEAHQRAIFDALFGPLGHKIAIQRTLTPAEELREMRAFMAQNSPLALHEFDKEIGR